MTAFHPLHSHHHRLHHAGAGYVLPVLLALLLFFLLARPVRGQVWIDESQLRGRLPEWVDARYEPAPPPPTIVPAPHRVWVEPVYRLVTERVWVAPVTQRISERTWVPDRYEYQTVYRREGDHLVCERVLVLVQPGHFETRMREVVIMPGHWETSTCREVIVDGHWRLEQ